MNINTELGKIYCKFNEEKDNFDMYRVTQVFKKDDKKEIALITIDPDTYHFRKEEPEDCKILNEEQFREFKKDYIFLESEGVVSLSNIVSVQNNTRKIKDVLLIYFPNNKYTKVPDVNQPYIVARQGVNNIFAEFSGIIDTVGISVSLDTLPDGYALSDFIANDSVEKSRITHVYKTDSAFDLNMLLNSEETDDIFKELFNQRVFYLSNIKPDFNPNKYDDEDLCLDGYCNTLHRFLIESGFMVDLLNKMGITVVDFDIKENVPLNDDDKLLLMTLYGGIRINKAVPLKFSYDINLNSIKMKYLLVSTTPNIENHTELFIVPYTEFPDEVPSNILYNLTEERTTQLQERLAKCVKAYEKSTEK